MRKKDVFKDKQVDIDFKKFIENSLEIILVVGEDGKILYGNRKAVETYGYTSDELSNLSVFELRKQDVKEFTQRQLNDALNRGVEFKTYHYRKDGSRFPVQVRSVCGNEEARNMVISFIKDMTAVEEIAKYDSILSTSLKIFEDPIIVFDEESKITYWSKGAEEKFGFKEEDILGKYLNKLVPEDKLEESNGLFDIVRNGNIVKNYEAIRLNKDGKQFNILISASPIYDTDGKFSGTIAIYKDITDKKELINKLKEYEERWRFALESGHFGVWDWDIEKDKVFYSNLFKVMLGYDEEDLSDSFAEWKRRTHPEDSPYIIEKLERHFKGEEYDIEFRMKCKDNSYKWIKSKGQVTSWDEDGKPLRMIGTNEDISQRKFIEQELMDKYKQLELLKKEADDANKAKSLFLANMSHELRTPLNGISATIQLLQGTDSSIEQNKYLKMLKESSNVLLGLINDLLDISKIEADSFTLNPEPFNLKEAINSIYNNLVVEGTSKGLEISYYLDKDINFQVIGDELRLKQILNNLVSNALKFTDDGYISFRVKKLSSDDNSEKIEFRIKDTGIGIENSFRDKIFNSFSQGDLSINKKYMGTGLGLSIAKQLAVLMNGDISFESTAGKGSTFIFTCEFKKVNLKVEDVDKNKIIEYKPRVDNIEHSKVILGVEDNIINQEVVENIVKRRGYKYIAAYNSEEALNIINNNKVDLILMDLQMPGQSGIEVTKIVRNGEKDGQHIPIIALTAYSLREDRDKCLQSGMDDYIVKPFDLEKFYQVIESHLNK